MTANRSSWWIDRRLVGLLMNERDQALLDGDRLKGDRQLPGINNQAVDFYQPGEGRELLAKRLGSIQL